MTDKVYMSTKGDTDDWEYQCAGCGDTRTAGGGYEVGSAFYVEPGRKEVCVDCYEAMRKETRADPNRKWRND